MSFEMCESVFLLKNCLRYIKSNTNIKSRPYENRDLHIIYRKFPVCRKIALSHTLLLADATSFSSSDYINTFIFFIKTSPFQTFSRQWKVAGHFLKLNFLGR